MRRKILALIITAGLVSGVGLCDAAAEKIQLPSGGTLRTGLGDQVITNRARLDRISFEGQGEVDPDLEAYWIRRHHDVYLVSDRIGYVRMDDWDQLDVDQLWESYVEGAKQQSERLGYQVRPLKWVIKPTLNRKKSIAYYAIEVRFGKDAPLINMVVLDFGRHGYEEMTIVQASRDFPVKAAPRIAKQVAAAFEFGPDSDYTDFKDGDTIAAVGAAGLIAASLGAKFGKGFLALALIFAKKFWFVLLLVPAALWRFIRSSAD